MQTKSIGRNMTHIRERHCQSKLPNAEKTASSYEAVNTSYLTVESLTQDNYLTKKLSSILSPRDSKDYVQLNNSLHILFEHVRKKLIPVPPQAPATSPSNQHRTFNQLNAIPMASTDKIALPKTLSFFLATEPSNR